MWSDLLVMVLLSSGAIFMAVAALGLLRLPDLYQRLHATSKAATLGVSFILLGAAIDSGELGVVARCLMAIVFFVLSAPVGAHLIGRAASHRGEAIDAKTLSNEWQDHENRE